MVASIEFAAESATIRPWIYCINSPLEVDHYALPDLLESFLGRSGSVNMKKVQVMVVPMAGKHGGQKLEKAKRKCSATSFMNAQRAKEYGIMSDIIYMVNSGY